MSCDFLSSFEEETLRLLLDKVFLVSSCQHFDDNPRIPAFKIKGAVVVLCSSLVTSLLQTVVEVMQYEQCSHPEEGFLWVLDDVTTYKTSLQKSLRPVMTSSSNKLSPSFCISQYLCMYDL